MPNVKPDLKRKRSLAVCARNAGCSEPKRSVFRLPSFRFTKHLPNLKPVPTARVDNG